MTGLGRKCYSMAIVFCMAQINDQQASELPRNELAEFDI